MTTRRRAGRFRGVPSAGGGGCFVGRRTELAELAGRFADGARLVTLVGEWGCGKTRLARRFAAESAGGRPEGALWCSLSHVRSLDDVLREAAAALGLEGLEPASPERVAAALAARGPCLLVIDDAGAAARHVAGMLAAWQERVPGLRVLAIARDALGLPGEQAVALGPLPWPEAVELFRRRAPAAEGPVEDAEVLRELVQLLDRLPLAIEIVAAQARRFAPAALLELIAERIGRLVAEGRRRDRQATLAMTVDWSLDLQRADDLEALARLAETGRTLEAAGVAEGLRVDPARAAASLGRLVDAALVRGAAGQRPELPACVQEAILRRRVAERRRGRIGRSLEAPPTARWAPGPPPSSSAD